MRKELIEKFSKQIINQIWQGNASVLFTPEEIAYLILLIEKGVKVLE